MDMWEFADNNIVRYIEALVEDPKPVTHANDSNVLANHSKHSSSNEHALPIQTNEKAANKENAPVPLQNYGRCQYYLPERTINLDEASRGNRQYSTKKNCQFCKNNGEPSHVYTSHPTKDKYGRVVCLRLRSFSCPICGATGDNAHTKKYCTIKPIKN